MNEHEKWLSRRVYQETFSTPGTVFPRWRGVSNRCSCGCAEVWYDRLSTTNWWSNFNPSVYISIVRGLVSVFRAFHGVLWHLPPVIWGWLLMTRAGYKRDLMNRLQPSANTTVAVAIARLLFYGIVVPLTVVVWASLWFVSRPGSILLIVVFFSALVSIAIVMSIAPIFSVIAISMRGFVLILGGVGSILYLDNPAVGIAAIVIGVGLEYELNRREGRRREEQIGYLSRMLRSHTRIDP